MMIAAAHTAAPRPAGSTGWPARRRSRPTGRRSRAPDPRRGDRRLGRHGRGRSGSRTAAPASSAAAACSPAPAGSQVGDTTYTATQGRRAQHRHRAGRAADRRARGHAVLDQPRRRRGSPSCRRRWSCSAAARSGASSRRCSRCFGVRVTRRRGGRPAGGARGAGGERGRWRRRSPRTGIQVLTGAAIGVGGVRRRAVHPRPRRPAADRREAARRGRAAHQPGRPRPGDRRARPRRRGARPRRADAGRRRALGDRRHHRQGRVHARVDVPGARSWSATCSAGTARGPTTARSPRVTFTAPEVGVGGPDRGGGPRRRTRRRASAHR